MIRRSFITVSVIVAAGISTKAASLISSKERTTKLLPLEEEELLKFRNEIKQSLQKYPNAEVLAKNFTTPSTIIKRDQNNQGFRLTFKNLADNQITLIEKNGISSLIIS